MLAVTYVELPQWGTMTLLELIWLVIGMTTVIFTGWMLYAVVCGYMVTEHRLAKRAARQYVRREIVRFVGGWVMLGVGIYITFLPNLMPGPYVVSLSGLTIICTIYVIMLLSMVQSVGDYIDRRRLIHDIKEEPAIDC